LDETLDTLLGKMREMPSNTPEPIRGTRRYVLGHRLGGGQFGEVFVARDREHGSQVALKVLRRADADWLYRFKREFRVVADIAHPNLVRLYELFEENDRWYLTMERVDGIPFDDHLARAPEQLRSCFSQLASAIRALHRAGALHRDIKPSNALVEVTGRVVLLDFGLTRGSAAAGATMVAGTPHYMAPEQWTGELGEASDWYAFGVMLYEALAGRPPFAGEGVAQAEAKLRGPPPLDGPDPALARLATRLLEPKPSERPTGDEIVALLRADRPGQPPATERPLFAGRDRELDEIAAAAAHDDGPVLIAIQGEPGIGKTALARAFAERARAGGANVYQGRCYETESVPYKGLDGVIDMMSTDLRYRSADDAAWLLPGDGDCLAEMFPVLKRIARLAAADGNDDPRDPAARRRAAIAALRALFARLRQSERLILFIDDLQWAGDDTFDLLVALLSPPAAPPVVLLTTARSGDENVHRFLDRVRELTDTRLETVELAPLDRDGVVALVAAHDGLELSPDQAWRDSGGHPYLLTWILSGTTSGDLASRLRDVIRNLSADARKMLDLVALAAHPLTQSAAFAAAGLGSWRAGVVDELRRLQLTRSSGVHPDALIEPYHDRVREVVVADMDADALRRRHAELARYLEQHSRATAHILAHHYRAAGSQSDAVQWTRRAARDAVRGLAFARADQLYREAANLADDRIIPELCLEWAEAMVQAGRRTQAAGIYLAAATRATNDGEVDHAAELRTRAGEQWILAGHFDHGIELIENAMSAAGVEMPADPATATALAFNVGAALSVRGLEFRPRPGDEIPPAGLRRCDLLLATARALMLTDARAPYLAARAVTDALDLGEPERVQRALCYFVINNAARDPDNPLFVDAESRAGKIAEQRDDDIGRAWVTTARGIRLRQAGDFARAWPLLVDGERRFRMVDPPMLREAGGVRIMLLACGAGDGVALHHAIDVVEEWRAEAESRDDLFSANWLRILSNRVCLAVGDPDEAEDRILEARAIWPNQSDDMFASTVILGRMAHALYTDPDGAHALGAKLEQELLRLFVSAAPIVRSQFYGFFGFAASTAAAAGTLSPELARQQLERSAVEIGKANYNAPAALALSAQLSALGGDPRAAADQMLSAARDWHQRDQTLPAMSALLRRAQLIDAEHEIAARTADLRRLGVGDPDRYATVIVGPGPRQGSSRARRSCR
jgi:MoxR-like ATPase